VSVLKLSHYDPEAYSMLSAQLIREVQCLLLPICNGITFGIVEFDVLCYCRPLPSPLISHTGGEKSRDVGLWNRRHS
jgi:hypothetical protein